MRTNDRILRRLRKLAWRFHRPAWADHHGVLLPVTHPLISPGIAKQIYLGDYEAKELEIVSRRLEADDVFFEVGAGLGFLSTYCAQKIGSSRVFAYEAHPGLIPLIQETYARNGVTPELTHALLAQGNGEREFHVAADFWASSAHRPEGEAIMARQIDVNEELARIKPSFLMVDIEGGEAELLACAHLEPVRKLCIETHPDVLGNKALSEMFASLITRGFSLDFTLMRKNVFFFQRTA